MEEDARREEVVHTSSSKVIRSEVVWGLEWEVVNQPAMTERTVRHICDAEFACCVDETICFVQSLKCTVLRLKSIDFGNCNRE